MVLRRRPDGTRMAANGTASVKMYHSTTIEARPYSNEYENATSRISGSP